MMKNKNLVRLSEFLSISDLSAEQVLRLIEGGALKLHHSDGPPVMVDLSDFKTEDLKSVLPNQNTSLDKELSDVEQEIVAGEITAEMQTIIREAYKLAKQWQEK